MGNPEGGLAEETSFDTGSFGEQKYKEVSEKVLRYNANSVAINKESIPDLKNLVEQVDEVSEMDQEKLNLFAQVFEGETEVEYRGKKWLVYRQDLKGVLLLSPDKDEAGRGVGVFVSRSVSRPNLDSNVIDFRPIKDFGKLFTETGGELVRRQEENKNLETEFGGPESFKKIRALVRKIRSATAKEDGLRKVIFLVEQHLKEEMEMSPESLGKIKEFRDALIDYNKKLEAYIKTGARKEALEKKKRLIEELMVLLER